MLRGADKRMMMGGVNPLPMLDGQLPPPTFLGNSGLIESATAVNLAGFPGGLATGDITIIVIESNTGQPGTVSGGTGTWTQFANSPQSASDTCLAAWWHRYTSGDSVPQIDDVGDHMVASCLAFRGCGLGGNDPAEVTAGTTAAASTSVSFPTLTTYSWNCLILHLVAIGRDAIAGLTSPWLSGNQAGYWVNDTLSAVMPLFDRTSTIGGGGGWLAAMGVKGQPGPVGTTTTTIATSQAQGLMTIALR